MIARFETADLRPAAAFENLNSQLRYRATLQMPIHMNDYLINSGRAHHCSTWIVVFYQVDRAFSRSLWFRVRTQMRPGILFAPEAPSESRLHKRPLLLHLPVVPPRRFTYLVLGTVPDTCQSALGLQLTVAGLCLCVRLSICASDGYSRSSGVDPVSQAQACHTHPSSVSGLTQPASPRASSIQCPGFA